jgi:hypothetical protein
MSSVAGAFFPRPCAFTGMYGELLGRSFPLPLSFAALSFMAGDAEE